MQKMPLAVLFCEASCSQLSHATLNAAGLDHSGASACVLLGDTPYAPWHETVPAQHLVDDVHQLAAIHRQNPAAPMVSRQN